MWNLFRQGDTLVYMIEDGTKSRTSVTDVQPGRKVGKLVVKCKRGEQYLLDMKDFDWDENDFSRTYKDATTSRADFVSVWRRSADTTLSIQFDDGMEAQLAPKFIRKI